MKSKTWTKILIAIFAVFILIQFIPYGREHSNPPVNNKVNWDSPQTKETFYNACADCHSHETDWPWYSHIAPVSWLVQSDVDEGREHFNISTKEGLEDADHAAEMVKKDKMPLGIYVTLHSEANLGEEEKEDFIAGLKATFQNNNASKEEEQEETHEEHEH